MTSVLRAPEGDEELAACFRVAARGFNIKITPEAEAEFRGGMHVDRMLAVFVDGDVAAWSQVRPFGQFFGGRSVAMGGYSPVVAAPEHRGHGYGSTVTAAHYPLMRERGEVLAGLYPASTQLYRGVGFEIGGVHAMRKLPTRSLHKLRGGSGIAVRRAVADDLAAIKDCYRRFAATQDGWLDRPEVWWERLLPVSKIATSQHVYVVDGEGGEVRAYIRYAHRSGTDGGYSIEVAELCAPDPDLLVALWRLVGSSSTQADFAQVVGPPEHPLLLLLADQDLTTTREIRWMTRIVDASGAIAARGFPAAVSCEVDIDLTDRQCDWNAGGWHLSVSGGVGTLTKGGTGAVSMTANALASLYTGYARAETLQSAGLVSGGTTDQLGALTAAFAGPTPTIADFY